MFAINDDMFGLYARIPTGFSNEPHYYKIVSRLSSNGYCDLPLGTCNTKQTRHGEIVPVLLVIHCGIDESEVIRVKEGDCEIVNSRLSELAEADKDGRCVVLPCKVGAICYEIDPGHPGAIKHTVTGTTVYNRRADGNRYMTDFVNVITIDTQAVAEDGCEWADQYTAEEWADAPKTRTEAEATLASTKQVVASTVASEVHKPGGEQE
jgi:hypothetical protein